MEKSNEIKKKESLGNLVIENLVIENDGKLAPPGTISPDSKLRINKDDQTVSAYNSQFIQTEFNLFPFGWKLFDARLMNKPRGVKQWLNVIWGFDLWFGKVPFLKVLIACNILVWLLFV